ncbi:MAG: hypothetical protein Q9226_000880, partial [Calogaya cf. arnoldii]
MNSMVGASLLRRGSVWEKGSAEIEVAQGKSMADAAVATGVEHFIWSSLPNVTEMSNGKLSKVVH